MKQGAQTLCSVKGWDGVEGGRKIKDGGDICMPMANSC